MYCRFCGNPIIEGADVCTECGKLLHPSGKSHTSLEPQNKLFAGLSVSTLVFSTIFFIVGIISLISFLYYNAFELYYPSEFFIKCSPEGVAERYQRSQGHVININTNHFVSLLLSLISSACSAILSLILLVFNNKKILNIISLVISLAFLFIAGTAFFLSGF